MRTDFRNILEELLRADVAPAQKLSLLRQRREMSADAAERLDTALLSELTEMHSALLQSSQHLQLHERIEQFTAPPFFQARCLAIADAERGLEAVVTYGGQVRMVEVDEEIEQGTISPGDEVLLSSTLNRVVAMPEIILPPYGDTALLERELPDGGLLISMKGEARTVVATKHVRDQARNKGDLIQLDSSGVFAVGVVPGTTGEEYLVESDTSAMPSFEDIGGLDAEICRIKDLIRLHSQHADISKR